LLLLVYRSISFNIAGFVALLKATQLERQSWFAVVQPWLVDAVQNVGEKGASACSRVVLQSAGQQHAGSTGTFCVPYACSKQERV
jgi:hypothetical protein